MTEQPTASLSNLPTARRSRAPIMRDAWVVRMIQFGTILVLIVSVFNVAEFYRPRWSWALACSEFNVLLSIVCLSLTLTRWFTRTWQPVVLVLLTALVASNTVLGIRGQEPMLFFVSLLLLMTGTGSILPWSPRYQVSFNLVCLAAYGAQTFGVGTLAGAEYYELVGMLTGAALSWFSADARMRFITAHEESERISRESEGALRHIFDANTDGITLIEIPTRRIQDVNEHFLRISGFRREEVVGKTTEDMKVWADPEAEQEFLRRVANGSGNISNMEVSFRTRDGHLLPCLLSSVMVTLRGRPCIMTVVRDISDLRRSQEKIRQGEATQRRIFDASLDWMSIIDMDTGDYLDINESFARATGYNRDEIIASSSFQLRLWPDEQQRQNYAQTLHTAGEVRNQPITVRKKDGTLIPCLVSAVQCELWGKRCCISTARDITDLDEAQAQLRRSEETFRQVFDASLDAMSIVDALTGEYIDVNPEFVRTGGFTREETIGHSGEALGRWANLAQWAHFKDILAEKGEVRNQPGDLRHKDGTILSCLISGVMVRVGGRLCCLGVSRDISELKAAEQSMRKSEGMLRAIFDSSLDGISLVDLTSQALVEVNTELARLIGYRRDEMIGKSFRDLVPIADPVREEELVTGLMQGREMRNFEITFATRDQRTFPALLSAAPVTIEGRPYMLSVTRDITDLVTAREAALAAARAKSEFLSIMSHEIRTPMNAILGMADLIGESELNFEQRRYLDTILNNGNALLELINSILDLAKVESGRLSLEMIEIDLIEVTERAADTLAVRAHERGLELAVRFAPGLPPILLGDPYRLRQILINLIGNAIKFTQHGEVVVSVERNPDSARPDNLLFAVRDTRIGIAPDKVESIFSIFNQADTSTTRNFGGSGLGLAIVERLVALMGGRVWVESVLGVGSTFFFTADLPMPRTLAQLTSPREDLPMRGRRVLMLAENATARAIAADLLHQKGCAVTEADAEAAALAALESAHRAGAHFALLLVDCEMRVADSFAVLRRLRALEPEAQVILLMNSVGLPHKLLQMRQQSLQHYCIKPLKQGDFNDILAEVMATPSPLPARTPRLMLTAAPALTITDRPLRILIADDSPDNRMLIRAYTKKTPYLLTEAQDGQIAVERFIDGNFDLVLMDIQMPVLDGYSAVRTIRQFERANGRTRTPIVALSASALEEDVRRAMEAGCDMHVSKPVKKLTLLEAIGHAIATATIATGPGASARAEIVAGPASIDPRVATESLPT